MRMMVAGQGKTPRGGNEKAKVQNVTTLGMSWELSDPRTRCAV